eukprot:9701501-Heterocapsa_arctica.AAC.1
MIGVKGKKGKGKGKGKGKKGKGKGKGKGGEAEGVPGAAEVPESMAGWGVAVYRTVPTAETLPDFRLYGPVVTQWWDP